MSGSSHAPTVARDGGVFLLRVIGTVSAACGVVAAMMIVVSVLITCQMIWVRFVLGESTVWQTESVIYLMIGATMIGLPYVQRLRGHVNVDLLPMMLPRPARMALALLTIVAGIVVVAVMFWYGFELWHLAWARNWRSESVWAIELWIPYIALPIGFGLYLVQLGADFYALVTGIEKPFGIGEER